MAELLVRHRAPRRCRRPFGVRAGIDEEGEDARRLDDLAVVAADVVAVPFEHVELAADGDRVAAADVAGIAPLSDQFEGDLLAAAADPERWVRLDRQGGG